MNDISARIEAGTAASGARRRDGGPVRVALVGAGNIAAAHAEVLKGLPGVEIAAVVDTDRGRAERLAARFGGARVLDQADALIDGSVAVDCVHVLVPPPLHFPVALPLLEAGLDVLLEKPMAESDADCAALQRAAAASGARLSVNQNFVHHPAEAALAKLISEGRIGPVRHVACEYSMPLRQLEGRQFGHWMFASVRNLLLEQMVHPLSQIRSLVGPLGEMSVLSGPPRRVDDEMEVIDDWQIAMRGERAGAELHFRLGCRYPVWRIHVIGDDGEASADMLANRMVARRPTRWIEATDTLLVGWRGAADDIWRAGRNFAGYGLSMLGVGGRSDAFFRSMKASIEAFYHDRQARPQALDGGFGRELVALCEAIAGRARVEPRGAGRPATVAGPVSCDVAVLGGTGFIGRQVVRRLVETGSKVAVVARSVDRLPELFCRPEVQVVRGSIGDRSVLARVFESAPVVVNLAHGGGEGRAGIERAMVGGARLVAEEALAAKVPHLIFASSIAALNLGDPASTVTAATPPDGEPDARADYARAKVLAERELQRMASDQGLPLTIVRPGVVVGEGTSPFHSGVGFFNRESHCLGWNDGRNPLPLVLADDVAEAILAIIDRRETSLGKSYNLIGDVRLSARDYLAELARSTGRPLVFHPGAPWRWHAEEMAKWLIKRLAGRRGPMPRLHDFRSRALAARFDTGTEKTDLGWQPEASRELFLERAFRAAG